MDLFQAVILALVQGVTEFLPISSSAHLVLAPMMTDWPDQGLSFDVAMNTATWLAVVLYFRADLARMGSGLLRSLKDRSLEGNPDGRLAWLVIAATIPVAVAGLLARDYVAGPLRSIWVIGGASIVWGLVLYAADRRPGAGEVTGVRLSSALVVGVAQALALVPGTSRSGITITAGLMCGLTRPAAARFSFLLAVIVGALAGGKEGAELAGGGTETPWLAVIVGFVAAFTSAYLVIHFFLRYISRASMTPFVVYRVALGVVLLAVAAAGVL